MKSIFQQFSLRERVALVTGGAGLLGKEFCRTLARAGAQVIIADSNREEACNLADMLSSENLKSLVYQVDVTHPGAVKKMTEKVFSRYGRIDILVCSAAIDPKFDQDWGKKHSEFFEDYSYDLWKQSLEVNLSGIFLCAQACGRVMQQQTRGAMIFLSSTYGLVGPDQRIYMKKGTQAGIKPVSYSVTKAGVLGLTRYLASYYAGKNIRVNALTPGGIDNNQGQEFIENYSSRTILGRLAKRDEMNGALLFLASDASSYMTGGNLVVDGGWTAW